MDEATSRRIFEPFFTTKEVGKGTGLGLSMVYGIVRDHDGYIDWETAPDTGTAFHIYLPALANSIVAGRVEAEAKADVTAGSGTLLVVDDEADIREVLKEGLEGLGYKVLLAASGEECLDIYRREGAPVDLIVLDLGMPGMGGRACFAELKKINPAARVLVASGYGASVAGQIASSAAGFLAKPYRLADIVKKIKELLGH
jgi:CheY-like chemotaxis protein